MQYCTLHVWRAACWLALYISGAAICQIYKASQSHDCAACIQTHMGPSFATVEVIMTSCCKNSGHLTVNVSSAVYCWYIFFSKLAPGAPGYMPPPGTFSELFNESLNYFYINIFLNAVHLPGIPAHAVRSCLSAYQRCHSQLSCYSGQLATLKGL